MIHIVQTLIIHIASTAAEGDDGARSQTVGANSSVAKLAAMFAQSKPGGPPIMGMLQPGMQASIKDDCA
jgi:hypothetical protein